ncbi:zinc finger protein 830 [Bacillus rossius redtenbacheri]|uniref:zinc finger protein 830 n=1 Tax=Bacillus rossius redtenbacheri TaxID=93214 RepID=UPI002FDE02BE
MNKNKKKISQNELRRIMNEKKLKLAQTVKKIDSPLAKYVDGRLTCLLCDLEVRSEAVWGAHINGRAHRDNIAAARWRKEDASRDHSAVPPKPPPPPPLGKRPAAPQPRPPAKRVRGILKNSQEPPNVPVGFFDDEQFPGFTSVRPAAPDSSEDEDPGAPAVARINPDDPLPEGFFDDPLLDAKARHVEYKDPVQEEWEKFQREMKEETTVSAQIIAEDQEEATAERQLDEIDEQIRNWSRVLDLERKKEEVARSASVKASALDDDGGSSADEAEFDEYLDWRAKKSFN